MGTATYKNKDKHGNVHDCEYTFDSINELNNLIDFDNFLSTTEIVNYICSTFDEADIIDIKALKFDELIAFHMTTGMNIRNTFGLWLEGNPYVGSSHPDDVSHEIIEKVWKRFNEDEPLVDDSQVMDF